MKIPNLILISFLLFSLNTYACEEEKEKSDCSKGSEYTWNPSSKNTPVNLNRFYELDGLINEQYENGNYLETKELIKEYLELALIYNNNWNYGNAIHDANRILGLISYKEGKIDEATRHLIKSSESTGSPQLDTFGPEMNLANLLLKEGKIEEVKTYLTGITKFWDMDNGAVEGWLKQIEAGEIPELNRFGADRVTWWQKLINWLGLLWPLIAVIGIYFKYKDILVHWKFISTSMVGAYLAMVAGGFVSGLIMIPLIETVSTSLITFLLITITFVFQFLLPLALIYWFSTLKFFHGKGS